MTPADAPLNWARRLTIGLGLLVTLGLIGLHLEYYRHPGRLWRDEVNSVNVATMPSFAEVFANSQFDSPPWPGSRCSTLGRPLAWATRTRG